MSKAIREHIRSRRDDAMITRLCRNFDAFAKDEATAKSENKKYYIESHIGSGATGFVLSAKRTSDEQTFAVKVVDLEGMSEADKIRAQTEVHCLLNCDFFSILKCHEDFAKRDPKNSDKIIMIALVLDYATSGNLRDEIKRRKHKDTPFKEHEAGVLFVQILMAIHHVHSQNMLHRDIKSANILLCSNGLVKLGDFGFSKQYSGSVAENVGETFCGTPYYVPPEIWRRQRYSKKADMFSLGVLLYELLTLKRPFDGDDVTLVMKKTLTGKFDPLPDTVSEEMAELVGQLLETNPVKRLSSEEALSSSLVRCILAGFLGAVSPVSAKDCPTMPLVVQQVQQLRNDLFGHRRVARSRVEARLLSALQAAEVLNVAGAAPKDNPSPMGAALRETDGVDGLSSSDNNSQVQTAVLYSGTVDMLSCNLKWKRRYLSLVVHVEVPTTHSTEQSNTLGDSSSAVHVRRVEIVLGLSKDAPASSKVSCVLYETDDVFAVPARYVFAEKEHVFAIAKKNGSRVHFSATDDEERDRWIRAIQDQLGMKSNEKRSDWLESTSPSGSCVPPSRMAVGS